MSRPQDTTIIFEDAPTDVADYPRDRFPLIAWWSALDPRDQALYQGLITLAAGLAADPFTRTWALAFVVPGAVMTLVALVYLIVPVLRRGD